MPIKSGVKMREGKWTYSQIKRPTKPTKFNRQHVTQHFISGAIAQMPLGFTVFVILPLVFHQLVECHWFHSWARQNDTLSLRRLVYTLDWSNYQSALIMDFCVSLPTDGSWI